jgi:hypothetical protein
MLTMKPSLVLIAFLAAAAVQARAALPAGQQVSDARAALSKAASASNPSPHQLSAQQRAELRRQLYEYSRLHGKGS